jgi:hypothetical protein
MIRATWGAASLGLTLLLLAPAARAHDDAQPNEGRAFRLAYDAPELCPDRAAFVDAIRARTVRPHLVLDETQPAIALRVSITVGGESASGKLHIREPDGTEDTRTLAGRTCLEIAKGLALVAALVLDPDARTEPEPTPPLPLPPEPTVDPLPLPPPKKPERAPPFPPPPKGPHWQPSVGAEVGGFAGVGPAIAPMAGFYFELERFAASRVVASARLAFDVATTTSAFRDGNQTYEWIGATLRITPIVLSLPFHLRLAPTISFQTAAHRGTTRNIPNAAADTNLWLAPGVGGTFEWAVSSAVGLEMAGGALFPLRRTRYFLAPDTTLFEAPAVGATATLGVRIRFL